MKNSDSFSLKNALLACGYEFSERRRTQLLRGGALLGILTLVVFTIIFTTGHKEFARHSASDNEELTLFVGFFIYLGFTIGSTISASMMLSRLGNKASRITYLMTPLSSTEKFVGQWLFYVVGFTLLYVVAAAVALGISAALIKIIYEVNIFDSLFLYQALHVARHEVSFINAVILLVILIPFAEASYYVAGSAFFPRYTFLKTLLATYVIQVIGNFIFIPGLTLLDFMHKELPLGHGVNYLIYFANIMLVTITLFNWWIAARRFRETDVI